MWYFIISLLLIDNSCVYLVFLPGDDCFVDEFVRVLLEQNRHLFDRLVHQWLRKHRLIDLIMTVATITDLQGMIKKQHISLKYA